MKMPNLQAIIEKHGGIEKLKKGCYEGSFYIKLEKKHFMPLVIEYVGEHDGRLPLISVAHYYTQNGDAMRDPEMVLIVNAENSIYGLPWDFQPQMFQQDNLGIYDEIIFKNEAGKWMVRPQALKSAIGFMKLWDRNMKDQGFLDAQNTIVEKEVA